MYFTRSVNLLLAAALVAAQDGFLKMGFDILQGDSLPSALQDYARSHHHGHHHRRDGNEFLALELANADNFYVAKISVGTPAQEISVVLDTGSSDLWITASSNPNCIANGGSVDCAEYGSFDYTKSSSFTNAGTSLAITYIDGTNSKGYWASDNVSFGSSATIPNITFGVANVTDSSAGVCGISFPILQRNPTQYDNLPILLKKQGIIQSESFSLYLTSETATTGSILFGAYDNAKFEGTLEEIPIPQVATSKGTLVYAYLWIPLDSVSFKIGSTVSSSAISSSSATSSVASSSTSSSAVTSSSAPSSESSSSVESSSSSTIPSSTSASSLSSASSASSIAESSLVVSTSSLQISSSVSSSSSSSAPSTSSVASSSAVSSSSSSSTPSSSSVASSSSSSSASSSSIVVSSSVASSSSSSSASSSSIVASSSAASSSAISSSTTAVSSSQSSSSSSTSSSTVPSSSSVITSTSTTPSSSSVITSTSTTPSSSTKASSSSTTPSSSTKASSSSTTPSSSTKASSSSTTPSSSTKATSSSTTPSSSTKATSSIPSSTPKPSSSIPSSTPKPSSTIKTSSTLKTSSTIKTSSTTSFKSSTTTKKTSTTTRKSTPTPTPTPTTIPHSQGCASYDIWCNIWSNTGFASNSSTSTLNNIVKQIQNLISNIFSSIGSIFGFKKVTKGHKRDVDTIIVDTIADDKAVKRESSESNEEIHANILTGQVLKRDDSETIDVSSTSFILDSGTTYSYLPEALNKQIALGLDPTATLQGSGMYDVDCSLMVDGNYLVFTFQNKDIEVPLTRLIEKTGLTCRLGFVNSATPIFGDNLLRSCYTLFNLDAKTISIAQIIYTDDEDIQVIL